MHIFQVRQQDKVWFDNVPVGEKTLGNMMADLSVDANLSTRYTNHCLRATTVNLLEDAKQEGRHIIAVTQHASVNSLSSYSRTSVKKRKTMSDIISFGLKGNDTSEYVEPKKKQLVPVLPSTSTDSIPEDDDDLDNILRELDVDMELDIPAPQPAPVVVQPHQQQILNAMQSQQFMQPVFNNCTVTINYNFPK
jgi:hypothetical protein